MRKLWAGLVSVLLCGAVLAGSASAQQYTAIGDSLTRGTNATDGSDTAPRTGFVDAVDDVSNSVERFLDANRGAHNLTNLGVRGARVADVESGQLTPAINSNPDVVTLTVGANDVIAVAIQALIAQGLGQTPAQIEAGIVAPAIAQFSTDYNDILSGLRKAASNPFIVVANIPDLSILPAADDNPATSTPGDGYAPDAGRKAQLRALVQRFNAEIATRAGQNSVPVVDLFSATASEVANNTAGDGFHPNTSGYMAIAARFTAFLGTNAPVAVNDAAATDEDITVDINVLANDSDADGDTLRVARVAVTSATRGTVTINADGTLRYTPEANFNGQSTFSYTISDGTLEATATVTVGVRAINDAPIASDNAYSVSGRTFSIAAPGVLGNDSDVDGDVLRATIVAQPAFGTLQLNANGAFTYAPNVGFAGRDTFTYRASDGTLSSQATVTLQVSDNAAPIVTRITPGSGAILQGLKTVTGEARDESTSVVRVDYQIVRGRDSTYWTGSTWSATPQTLTATIEKRDGLSVTWTFEFPPASQVTDGKYAVVVLPVDGAGNRGYRISNFAIDANALSVSWTFPANTLNADPNDDAPVVRALPFLSGRAIDNAGGSGVRRVDVFFKRSSDGRYWSGRNWSRTPVALPMRIEGNTWSIDGRTLPLPSGANLRQDTYFLTAIAYDGADNRATDTITVRVSSAAPTQPL